MKEAVAGELAAAYDSRIVDAVREHDYTYVSGRLTVHLAREFGFCYGVDRAVDYAYQTRERFPDRQVFLTGEIIHNPHVNDQLRAMGIRFLTDEGESMDHLSATDVVILPAFGVTVAMVAVRPNPDQLAEINGLLASAKLKVRIATMLPLAQVKKAHQISASGHADGKIILRP